MRRATEHSRKLERLYEREDGRLQGHGAWRKFPFFWFILFLSYRCTRRCDYCYAFNQVGDERPPEMDEAAFSRLLDWIPEVWQANQVKVNAISFLGGEPLLRTDRIGKVMDAVRRRTDGMQGMVTTNGDLLDEVRWQDLEAIQWFTVNITDISMDELARRLRVIGRRSNAINQTIAATLDDNNLDRAVDITRFALENGYRLRFNRDFFKGTDAAYKARLLPKYHEICDALEAYALKGYDVHTTFLLDTLIPAWDMEASPYHCGRRIAAVFPDGSIGPCLRNHMFKTGTIFDEHPLERLQCGTFHFDVHRPGIPDECRSCDCREACQGGCPNDKMVLTGALDGKSVMCDVHKEIIPRLRGLQRV
ncbi:MAG: SPASM domain-containing protein [Desulfosarcinaceae bacterium]